MATRTVVIQSCPEPPPGWLARCMESVRAWAAGVGCEYRRLGDEIFDRLPAWVRTKTAERPMVATDLARLLLIEECLAEGAGTAIWLDADVLVLDPDALTAALDLRHGYLLGREIWMQLDDRGRLRASRSVHNALLAGQPGNPFLPFYREAATRILQRHQGTMVPQLIGPKLLTALDNMIGLPATPAVNMASPPLLRDILAGGGPALELFRTKAQRPPAALNLCHSLAGSRPYGIEVTAAMLEAVIDLLQTDPGVVSPGSSPL